mmetsp:Transcript_32354/g.126816  ORF Transcript_32354/g.126816 Transcript_32354/m.126816 type:complete len:91 (+) Transcript_32354:206-478(+)
MGEGVWMSQESGELDALLPEGTVVRIAGNNRTKWDLVGKKGVVRNAQTLGGWHEVVLEGSTSAAHSRALSPENNLASRSGEKRNSLRLWL